MKNLLTQWELRKKTDLKLEPRGLLLLGFVTEAVKWPAALPSSAAEPSCWRSNHCGSEPSEVAVDERRGRFSKKKKDRSTDEKPPNPMGNEEENRYRKLLGFNHFSSRLGLHLGYLIGLPS